MQVVRAALRPPFSTLQQQQELALAHARLHSLVVDHADGAR